MKKNKKETVVITLTIGEKIPPPSPGSTVIETYVSRDEIDSKIKLNKKLKYLSDGYFEFKDKYAENDLRHMKVVDQQQ